MVFYESASCLHGRPTPFNGNFFANTYVVHSPPTIVVRKP